MSTQTAKRRGNRMNRSCPVPSRGDASNSAKLCHAYFERAFPRSYAAPSWVPYSSIFSYNKRGESLLRRCSQHAGFSATRFCNRDRTAGEDRRQLSASGPVTPSVSGMQSMAPESVKGGKTLMLTENHHRPFCGFRRDPLPELWTPR